MKPHLPVVLAGIAVLLVLGESGRRARVGAALAVGASGLLGVLALDLRTGGLQAGGTLAPLFAGLFGAPVLVEALGGDGVPPQADPAVTVARRAVFGTALLGTVAGAVVGYVSGVSSGIAATGALAVLPSGGPRAYVVITSGVNTANTVFALFALVALRDAHTGVLVALDGAGVPLNLPLLLAGCGLAAVAGFLLVLWAGDRYLAVAGRVDQTYISVGVLALLCVLVATLAGSVGLGIFAVSTAVGLVPARFGARRVTLMGVLLVPLAVGA